MRALQTTLLAAAAAAVRQAAAMRPAALHPTAAMRPPAPMHPTALATRRCILPAPLVVTRRCILAAPAVTLAAPAIALPRRANALYDTKTVDAAKNTYDVADATKCKAYLPLLDASGKTLDELSTNWDRIATDGDSVRRYLGTVGTTSPVFGIQKVFLKLADVIEPKDPELYFETLERMVTKISDADAEAYAANFVTFSSAKGKPEDFYARAAKQVVDARKEWLVLLQQLGLDS